MRIGKTAKSIEDIKNFNRITAKLLLSILLSLSIVTPFNCKPPAPNPSTRNEAPDTQITKKFKDGEVEYNLSGRDDGSVDSISARFNSGNYQNFSNGSLVLVPIISGANTVEARAYDDEGKVDPTPAIDTFISPTEEQARTLIDNIFSGRSGTYSSLEKDVLVSLGDSNFYVDYLIKRDGKPDVHIDYVGYTEELEEKLSNKEQSNLYGIPNLYLIRIPESEINLKLNDFIDNDYN